MLAMSRGNRLPALLRSAVPRHHARTLVDIEPGDLLLRLRRRRARGDVRRRRQDDEAEMTGTLVHVVPVRLGYGFFGLGRPRASRVRVPTSFTSVRWSFTPTASVSRSRPTSATSTLGDDSRRLTSASNLRQVHVVPDRGRSSRRPTRQHRNQLGYYSGHPARWIAVWQAVSRVSGHRPGPTRRSLLPASMVAREFTGRIHRRARAGPDRRLGARTGARTQFMVNGGGHLTHQCSVSITR